MDLRPYDCTTVRPTAQGATFSMRGQLYHGHYLSHYVIPLDTPWIPLGYPISVRQEIPEDDNEVRIFEYRASV